MQALTETDPERLGNWKLLARIGSGGMGTVFLAEHERRIGAVKVISELFAVDPEYRRRFRNEVETLSRVQSAYVVKLLDADPDAPAPWFAMHYESATDLQVAIARSGAWTAGNAGLFLAKLADGIAALHREGIVHRDLKPANVLVADDGPKIIDLGVVRRQGGDQTGTFAPMTEGWSSPEQIEAHGEVTAASDVFNLGLVAAFVLTGGHPFGEFDSPRSLLAMIVAMCDGAPTRMPDDPTLRDLIAACFRRSPEDRPTALDFANALRAHHRGQALDVAGGDFGTRIGRLRGPSQFGTHTVVGKDVDWPLPLQDRFVLVPRSVKGQASTETWARLVASLTKVGKERPADADGVRLWERGGREFTVLPESSSVDISGTTWEGIEASAERLGIKADIGGRAIHLASEWGGPIYVKLADEVRQGRAHFVAVESTALRARGSTEEIKAAFPRHGQPWDEVEEEGLVERFLEGAPLEELVGFTGRSPRALCDRLAQRGVVEAWG